MRSENIFRHRHAESALAIGRLHRDTRRCPVRQRWLPKTREAVVVRADAQDAADDRDLSFAAQNLDDVRAGQPAGFPIIGPDEAELGVQSTSVSKMITGMPAALALSRSGRISETPAGATAIAETFFVIWSSRIDACWSMLISRSGASTASLITGSRPRLLRRRTSPVATIHYRGPW